MIEIEIDKPFQDLVEASILEDIAKQVLTMSDSDTQSDLGLKISDDETLQQFNQQYMGVDAPTDVLSFPVSFHNPDTGNPYIGDILISYPRAAVQAETSGHATEEEVKLLLVHGLLHLLGYDHTTPEEKESMWSFQDRLLTDLQINARPTE